MKKTFCVIAFSAVVCMSITACTAPKNKAPIGAIGGAAGGAAIGQAIGKDTTSTLLGAGIGLALGYIIGNEWDKYDEQMLNKLETTKSNQPIAWTNPDNGNQYQVTANGEAGLEKGKIYRPVQFKAVVDGEETVVNTKAYRDAQGNWQIVS